MIYTNQDIIIGYTDKIREPFIAISQEDMAVASRHLSANGLLLWIYMHKIKTVSAWGLSPIDVERYTKMCKSTYRTQKKELIKYGYLRKAKDSTYKFYPFPYDEFLEEIKKTKENSAKQNLKIESAKNSFEAKKENSEIEDEDDFIEGLDNVSPKKSRIEGLDDESQKKPDKYEGAVEIDDEISGGWIYREWEKPDELDEAASKLDDADEAYEEIDEDFEIDLE